MEVKILLTLLFFSACFLSYQIGRSNGIFKGKRAFEELTRINWEAFMASVMKHAPEKIELIAPEFSEQCRKRIEELMLDI